MPTPRRWLTAWFLALALLPGVELGLLAHGHATAGPIAQVSPDASGAEALPDCAACQARASLHAMAIDAHPERHGAAPPALILVLRGPAPLAPRFETPYVRGPPLRIV